MRSAGWWLDHVSLTVPNLDQAVDFFVNVTGAVEVYRRTIPRGSAPEEMAIKYNAHREAGYRLVRLDLGGSTLELFEYDTPDQARTQPRNCDVGGHHLGLGVTDLEATLERVRSYPNTRILGDVSSLPPGHPLAGRTWVYFLTPWGQQLELVSDAGRT